MKIMICGSMTFAKEMLAAKKELEKHGHKSEVSLDTQQIADGQHCHDNLEEDYKHCIKTDVLRESFKQIEKSDALLILNYPKNNINGYIGTACLMEIGLAYYLGKKIFLLNPTPKPSEARWAHEIRIIQPVVINGDFSKVV